MPESHSLPADIKNKTNLKSHINNRICSWVDFQADKSGKVYSGKLLVVMTATTVTHWLSWWVGWLQSIRNPATVPGMV